MNKKLIEYICDLCNANFGNKKDHYLAHINRKKSCIKKNDENLEIKCVLEENNAQKIKNAQNKYEFAHFFAQNAHFIENKNILNTKNDEHKEIINRIILCPKISDLKKVYPCTFCKKDFNKKFNLNRHLNTCKEKILFENNTTSSNNTDSNNTDTNLNDVESNNDDISIIKKELNELKKNLKKVKKDNEILKKKLTKKESDKIIKNLNEKGNANTNINIVNNIVNNNNNNNIVNFNNVNYTDIDKKLFTQPIMNPRLYGKAIILQMIENIYINEAHPEYHNLIITDKNRGYVKIFNDGKWKTDDVQIINFVLDGIIAHSKTILDELTQIYFNNKQAKSRINTSEKYIKLCDLEYLGDLEDEHANGEANNTILINRCKDFREMVYKDTINLFHDNKNILLKPKNNKLIELK